MEWATLGASAGWAANDDRDGHPHAPVHLRCHVDNLVKTAGNEINKLHFGDRAHPHQGCTHGGPNDRRLSHRRIDHTVRTEFFYQTSADLESSTVRTNIFAQQEDRLITTHLFANGLTNCL